MSIITRFKRIKRGNKTFAEVDVAELAALEAEVMECRKSLEDTEKVPFPKASEPDFVAKMQESLDEEEDEDSNWDE